MFKKNNTKRVFVVICSFLSFGNLWLYFLTLALSQFALFVIRSIIHSIFLFWVSPNGEWQKYFFLKNNTHRVLFIIRSISHSLFRLLFRLGQMENDKNVDKNKMDDSKLAITNKASPKEWQKKRIIKGVNAFWLSLLLWFIFCHANGEWQKLKKKNNIKRVLVVIRTFFVIRSLFHSLNQSFAP